ncbi:low choriolytic enzyme-like [Scyliorhinus canicula]|uniref:low choriolytic enzyme-like n=1 Tax=Scyliorhinus canicula TaxID=7830 RepID=UPI0018F36361|nr:low choriolytic enzyme-like [Scyliorhinus canicula]
MDFTSAVLLNLSIVCIHLILVDTMNSTIQDGLREKQQSINEPDIFSIISKANNELIKHTGSKVIEYGDILVSTTRNARSCQHRSCLWPSSKDGNVYIPYVVDNKFSESDKQLIWKSLHEINSLTCLKFYYRRRNEPGYISVKSESGCYSGVGYGRNEQKLSLRIPECLHFGVIAHEFLHAIGFQHEQCRSDRDDHIKIMWDNIQSALKYNFNRLNTNNLGTVYDYGSIMQYGSTAFTKNGKPTMIPKPDPNVELGQIRGLSTIDVLKVNRCMWKHVNSSIWKYKLSKFPRSLSEQC